jgi:hypothetical protein
MTKVKEMRIGEFAEGYEPEIVHNYEGDYISGACRHAITFELIHSRSDGSTWESVGARVPRVIVAYNESRCNCTVVCLDCIEDELLKMKEKRSE